MCIIICNKKDTPLPSEALITHCWEQNPDFGGFAYINDKGRIVIEKHQTVEALYAGITTAKETYDTPMLIHMRKATKGEIILDNCHPFRINRETVFAHNGTLSFCHPEKEETKSDSRVLRDTYFSNFPDDWFNKERLEGMRGLFEGLAKDRIAFLLRTGEFVIYNEGDGEIFEDNWYSNDYYKTERVAVADTAIDCDYCGARNSRPDARLFVSGKVAHEIDLCWACKQEVIGMIPDIDEATSYYSCRCCKKAYGLNRAGWKLVCNMDEKWAGGMCFNCYESEIPFAERITNYYFSKGSFLKAFNKLLEACK